jgi:hypothetical protein
MSTIPLISTKQKKVYTVIVNNSTNINKTKECLSNDSQQFHQYQKLEEILIITVSTFFCFVDIGGIVDHHCLNFLMFCLYWRNCWLSLLKHSSNLNKPKESLSSDGRQFLQYKQSKRKFKQWWSTIPLISTKQKKVYTVIVLILVELLTITV